MFVYTVVWFLFLVVVVAYVTQWRNHVMDSWDFGLAVVLTFFWACYNFYLHLRFRD